MTASLRHVHPALTLCSLLLLATAPAQSQTLKDLALEALYVADKTEALHRAAPQRLAVQPDDAQAVLLGVQAMAEGLMKAKRSAGTVREALTAAHELEPSWYPGRSSLLEFYLAAPSFMGGSVVKATELARSAPRPEQVQALQARVAMEDKRLEAAAAGFMALPAQLEPALADDVRGWAAQAGLRLINNGQAGKAQALFERLLRERPQDAAGAYGLARVKGELGGWTEALRLYESAVGMRGASTFPILYRIGIAQQQLGRADAAKASLSSFVSAGKGQQASG